LQRVRKEAFKAIRAIYIEPLTSRQPPIFWESSESFREERDIEREIFEALRRVTIGEKDLKKHWKIFDNKLHHLHLHLSLVVILRKKNRLKEKLQRKRTSWTTSWGWTICIFFINTGWRRILWLKSWFS
jgi:hypothetical protein